MSFKKNFDISSNYYIKLKKNVITENLESNIV